MCIFDTFFFPAKLDQLQNSGSQVQSQVQQRAPEVIKVDAGDSSDESEKDEEEVLMIKYSYICKYKK